MDGAFEVRGALAALVTRQHQHEVARYGPVQEDMYMEFPKERFPADMVPEVGMSLNMSNGSGQTMPVVIAEVQDEVVILDANHPLAGEVLIFDLELVSIEGKKSLIISPY